MANRQKGEVSLTVEGNVYTLVLNTGAMVALEDLYSTPSHEATWDEVWARILKGSVKAIRAVIWAMLQKHHPDMTLTATQELIDQVGGLDGLQSVLTAAGGDASPDPKDVEALGIKTDANPRKAQTRKRRGTGGRSTAMPGASA